MLLPSSPSAKYKSPRRWKRCTVLYSRWTNHSYLLHTHCFVYALHILLQHGAERWLHSSPSILVWLLCPASTPRLRAAEIWPQDFNGNLQRWISFTSTALQIRILLRLRIGCCWHHWISESTNLIGDTCARIEFLRLFTPTTNNYFCPQRKPA